MTLAFHHITFTHDGATLPLFEDVTAHFDTGWTGIVGANGAGKTTMLHLAAGHFEAQQGSVLRPAHIVLCPQRTDDAPESLQAFLHAMDAEACTLRGRLLIEEDWASRWPTLSHGERKRAQLAVALWQQPDVMLVDEPTNHLDEEARALLTGALTSFRGIGLIVSHDRALLDLLCRQSLLLDPPRAVLRPGGYTQAMADEAKEAASKDGERQRLKQELEQLKRESKRRHGKAAQADRKKSKRRLARGDSDGRAKLDMVRVSGKDGQAGRLARQLDGRIAQLEEQVAAIQVDAPQTTRFWLDASTSPRRILFTLQEGEITLDEDRRLHFPAISMLRDDRIAVTGANGLGKSSFLRHLLRQLHIEQEHLVYLPQEIDLEKTRRIMADLRQLPREELGMVFSIVAALGSHPGRLLQNDDASPGELRKVLLALGVIRRPHLIIMDEPTNHLDLPAIACLERALQDCPCGLILVSHDTRFLSRVAYSRWHLTQNGKQIAMRMDTNFEHKRRE